MKTMWKHARGVTLMELLIVVVIVGILTAIAYPNYTQYVARAKRTEAKAALLQIATNQERFYLQNNTYTTDMRNLGFATAGNHPTDSGAYLVNVGAADANDFTATATYQLGGDEAGKCLTFNIDGRGARTSAPLGDCWTRSR
jgi:type IV pilus assembly protein PilE